MEQCLGPTGFRLRINPGIATMRILWLSQARLLLSKRERATPIEKKRTIIDQKFSWEHVVEVMNKFYAAVIALAQSGRIEVFDWQFF